MHRFDRFAKIAEADEKHGDAEERQFKHKKHKAPQGKARDHSKEFRRPPQFGSSKSPGKHKKTKKEHR